MTASTTKPKTRLARFPRLLLRLAVRALPTPASRARYRQELSADLYGLGYRRQVREAMSLLLHCRSLRSAVTPAVLEAVDLVAATQQRKPLLCYVHHRLRPFVTDEGVSYRRCIRCGHDHYDGGGLSGDNNVTGNFIGSILVPQN